MGDATTKFFHANATVIHRGNLINQLQDQDGINLTSHKYKEHLLWQDFKERLGKGEFTRFGIDLSTVLERRNDLGFLEEPITNNEIDAVIKSLPNDKSPRPDGFSNEFLKSCWSTIKEDFYNLCRDFHNNNVCLRSINSSFITLIPKVEGARTVNEYRPISLLNSSVKLLTKLLANRLQPVITSLVHKNQYGFIRARTIQDCLAWSLEYLHMCHHSKGDCCPKVGF